MQYRNAGPRSFSILPPSRIDWQNLPDRAILTNVPDHQVSSNQIKTTNSNFFTFIPINIFTQLSKSANIYFIVVAILQSIKSISVTNGQPMVLLPFSMVMIGVLLKDGYQEYSRYKKDKIANNQPAQVLTQNGFQNTTWESLYIGNIILVKKEQPAPCDFVVLQTSDSKGKCYVETKNLDGQTNYKGKNIPDFNNINIQKIRPIQLYKHRFLLRYEKPNPNLHHFNGSIEFQKEKAPLKISNLILRGSSIQIVDWVVGVCVYTGKETKLLLNFVEFRTKRSNLDQILGNVAILILLVQLVISFLCSLANYLIQQKNMIELNEIPNKPFYLMMGSWWLTMSYFVPISLIISLESVKLAQAIIMIADQRMKAQMNGAIPQVNNSSVNEDLGQIKYIFSDKTGTLTSNVMNFKVLSMNGKIYGDIKSQGVSYDAVKYMQEHLITNVNFQDKEFMKIVQKQSTVDFLRTLYLCHDVFVEIVSEEEQKYSSSSPDQIAFINFTKLCGYQYIGQQNKMFLIKDRHSKQTIKFRLLALLQFSSDRKRMSVIVQQKSGKIMMFTKGADNVIVPRVKNGDKLLKPTLDHIDQFSKNGFRTLILTKKQLQRSQFQSWYKQYAWAQNQIEQREQKISIVCDKIQKQLQVIGATGIQDKLQNNVRQTIEELVDAGIVIYMLTGDKRETAINVGRSSGLIAPNSKIIEFPSNMKIDQFQNWKTQNYPLPQNSVLVLNSSVPLNQIQMPLHSTICYRCTPSQKQNIVASVKTQTKQLTLAIGDGSNDVNMITKADVGISIQGVQGNDATRISDFVIGQFSLLSPLVLHYGRQWYRKNCKLVNYVMIKNIYHVAGVIGFGLFSMFSAQVIYQIIVYQFFNTFYTIAGGCLYAAFDQQWSMSQSKKYPLLLYSPGQYNRYFNYSSYFQILGLGMFYGIITSLIVFNFLQCGNLHNGGRTSYMFEAGMVVFFIIVFVSNMKVLLMAHTYHLILIVGIIASIIAYFVFYFCYVWIYHSAQAAMAIFTFWTTPNIWIVTGIVCFIALGLDFALKKYSDYDKNMVFNREITLRS